MSNLFYRGGGLGFNLSIIKENIYGPVHFFQGGGWGSICLLKKVHNTLAAIFNIMAITISLK